MSWPESERRSCTTCTENGRLAEIEAKLQDLDELKQDVKDVKRLLEQGKGAVKVFQILFYVIGPIVAAMYWIKEHVR